MVLTGSTHTEAKIITNCRFAIFSKDVRWLSEYNYKNDKFFAR